MCRYRMILAAISPLLGACPTPGEEAQPRPPEACRDAELAGDLRFEDATDTAGLPPGVLGNRLGAADWDGDGWADLWIARGESGPRDDFGGAARYHWLLRNLEGQGWEDVTESSGFSATRDGGAGRAWNFALWGDVDQDGDLDAVTILHTWAVTADLPDRGDRSEILLNDGTGQFGLADEPVRDELTATLGASWLDYDQDGALDLWFGNEYGTYGRPETAQQSLLLHGGGDGTFRDRTEAMGLAVPAGGGISAANAGPYNTAGGSQVRWPFYGAMACDIDGNGRTDLFGLTYGRGPNQLWLSDGDEFSNGWESGIGMDAELDWRDNQYFLCYCEDHPEADDCDGLPGPSIGCPTGQTWTPGWDDQPSRNGGNTFGGHCADLDGDGDLDVTLSAIHHWWAGEGSDSSTIYWNDGGSPPQFTAADRDAIGLVSEHNNGSWNEGDLNVAALDLDDDGVLDILRPQSDYPDQHIYIFRGRGEGEFRDVSADASPPMPRAAGMAVADFDGDGDLDYFTSFSTMRCDADCPWTEPVVRYYRNEEGQGRNSVEIRLLGRSANSTGIGARVTVQAEGRTQVQELMAGHGHMGLQNDTALHFGLGRACAMDSVSVQWPDGTEVETWTALPSNWPLTLVQGEAMPRWRGWSP